MKKIYTLVAALGLISAANAQSFWEVVDYQGAFPVTDGTPATDWTSGWANFDAQNTVYPATLTTLSGNVTSNTTISGVVLLSGPVYVTNNATLTIAPGTIVRGDNSTLSYLIVTKGAKLNAIGTAALPIVFTSNEAPGNRAEGDWGGVVLLGKAINNQPAGDASVEGLDALDQNNHYGGTNDDDNSGTLKYVRIEFPGVALQPNKEINGLTFGSVGKGTTIDYIQVSHSGDDSFEWFGGAVQCKHLIAFGGLDDDFDTDFGYHGKVQFGLIIRDENISDAIGDSNSFESDNDAAGSNAQPLTSAVFSNVTIVGPKGNGSTVLPVGETFEKAFRLRRNTAVSVFNTLVTGWEKGLSIEGASAEDNVTGDTLVFNNNILANFSTGTVTVTASPTFYSAFFGADSNDSTSTIAQINWVNIFTGVSSGNTPNARLNAGSVAATGADFSHAKFDNVLGLDNNNVTEVFMTLFPNPAKENINIAFESFNDQTVDLVVFNQIGQVVITEKVQLTAGQNLLTMPVSNLANGLYNVVLNSNNGKVNQKLLINN